jgi:hypothetical protein
MIKFYPLAIFLIGLNIGIFIGNLAGFKSGAQSVDFDRQRAQRKINECIEVIAKR